MAAAAVILGMMEGLERPCLGGPIVGLAPRTIIIDVGTNVDCKPAQLLSFAIIGEVFANQFWHIDRPKVALLSVGSETGKGNKQVRETTELLQASGLNFVGNVEGNDLPAGTVDVVVCDGFAGNVVMKLTEGIGVSLIQHLASAVNGQVTPEAMNLIKGEILKTTNPAQALGGGPLLGVNGVSIIGHGRADAIEVANAIATAKLALDLGFIERLTERLATVRATVEVGSEI
jgi:glycerol-3-phosphate acyltransferase PlsX